MTLKYCQLCGRNWTMQLIAVTLLLATIVEDTQSSTNASSITTCKRKKIHPRNSCRFMKAAQVTHRNQCKKHLQFELCSYTRKFNFSSRETKYSFSCDFARKYCQQLLVGTDDANAGRVTWKSFGVGDADYEISLEFLAQKLNFLFLQCRFSKFWHYFFKKKNFKFTKSGFAQQLFWFIREPEVKPPSTKVETDKPSISLIFVDSTSRTQFYRTFLETQKYLLSINNSSRRRVFDYKLFQSISTSTYWHLYNLFDGPNATMKDNGDIFYFKKAKTFFHKFKRAGYLTSYSWDLCYSFIWRGSEQWDEDFLRKQFFRFVGKHGLQLDDTGLADVTCEINQAATGSMSMFLPSEKCFNGRHFVDYQLSKLTELQEFWSLLGHRFITFFETNINHSNQMENNFLWDEHLKKYLQTAVKDPNIMIVIFSDHGNKFLTRYVTSQAPEGQTDITHPFLFVILPENEARFFSQSEVEAMRTNQDRLLTIRDLHYLLAKFWNEDKNRSNESGILREIPADRRCDDITHSLLPLVTFCICDHEEFPVTDLEITDAVIFLQGELNSMIPQNHSQSCLQLKLCPTSRESFHKHTIKDGSTVVSGMAEVKDYFFEDSKVVFSFHISEVKTSLTSETVELELINFDRIDTYSRFKYCIPRDFQGDKVCICAKNEFHRKQSSNN